MATIAKYKTIKASMVIAAEIANATTNGRPAIAEAMLDEFVVQGLRVVEIDTKGNCMVIAYVPTGTDGAVEMRFVGDGTGSAKVFANIAATQRLLNNAKLEVGVMPSMYLMARAITITDPTAELKKKHKFYVSEAASSSKVMTERTVQIGAAASVFWNTATPGSVMREAYDGYVSEKASVKEVNDNAMARVAALGAALTAAGISPVDYKPIVATAA